MEYPVIYLYIHKKLIQQAGINNVISKNSFYLILGRSHHIPKNLTPVVIKEMEKLGMIKNLGTTKNNNIELNPIKIDPEEQVGLLYKKVGLF